MRSDLRRGLQINASGIRAVRRAHHIHPTALMHAKHFCLPSHALRVLDCPTGFRHPCGSFERCASISVAASRSQTKAPGTFAVRSARQMLHADCSFTCSLPFSACAACDALSEWLQASSQEFGKQHFDIFRRFLLASEGSGLLRSRGRLHLMAQTHRSRMHLPSHR